MCSGFNILYVYYIIPHSSAFYFRTDKWKKNHREVLCSKFPENTADLVRFTEEILNGKLGFLCSVRSVMRKCSVEILTGILQTHWKVFCKITEECSILWHAMNNFLVKTQVGFLLRRFLILIKTWRWYRRIDSGSRHFKYKSNNETIFWERIARHSETRFE